MIIENSHAADKPRADIECREALINVPPILMPVGVSSQTEMRETSTIDISGIMKGIFSFSISGEQRKEIEIEYRYGDIDDISFLYQVNFRFLKKILDKIPAVLLGKVNKVTILFKRITLQSSSIIQTSLGISPEEKRLLSEAHLKGDQILLAIPYFSKSHHNINYFNIVQGNLLDDMRHQIGHVMAYHRYGQMTPDQNWRDAMFLDDGMVYGINTAEDFAEVMVGYLATNAGLDHPEVVRRYTYRFAILDEVVGLDPSERQRITERNQQIHKINGLLKQLGIIDNRGMVYEGIERDVPGHIRRFLTRHSNRMRMMKRLADKASALHKNGQLNFTSVRSSSVREKLVRKLVWPGIVFIPISDEENTPQFIIDAIDLLDASDSEIEHRLSIFNETIEFIERMDDQSVSNQEPYVIFERALREVQGRSN